MAVIIETQTIREALGWSPDKDRNALNRARTITSQWEGMTGRLWAFRTNEIYKRAIDFEERIINLPLYPLTALVVQSWANLTAEPSFATPLTRDTDYTASFEDGEVTLYNSPPANSFLNRDGSNRDANWKFDMTGGYTDENDLVTKHPRGYEIIQAMVEQIKFSVERNQPQSVAVMSKTISQGGTTRFREEDLHPEFARLAQQLRLVY